MQGVMDEKNVNSARSLILMFHSQNFILFSNLYAKRSTFKEGEEINKGITRRYQKPFWYALKISLLKIHVSMINCGLITSSKECNFPSKYLTTWLAKFLPCLDGLRNLKLRNLFKSCGLDKTESRRCWNPLQILGCNLFTITRCYGASLTSFE
jgi:hypothetical protein